jgi:flagellar motor switch protein FliG
MAEKAQQRPALQKAAILLQFLGEEAAAGVLKNLPMNMVQEMTHTILKMKTPTVEEVNRTIQEFFEIANQGEGFLCSGEEFAQKIIRKAFGKETAERIWEILRSSEDHKTFEALNQMDPKVITEFTKAEHPQTIAMILAHLEPVVAGRVLSQLPQATQTEVIVRLARLKKVSAPILQEISEILQTEVLDLGVSGEDMGGLEKVAVILNNADRSVESEILKNIRAEDAELAEGIQNLMFVFEDLLRLDDRAIQEILREIDTKLLSRALRGASDEVKEKIFQNMSERAVQVLLDEMETMGPTRLSSVEEAQKDIIRVTLDLRDQERIVIQTAGEDDVLI